MPILAGDWAGPIDQRAFVGPLVIECREGSGYLTVEPCEELL